MAEVWLGLGNDNTWLKLRTTLGSEFAAEMG